MEIKNKTHPNFGLINIRYPRIYIVNNIKAKMDYFIQSLNKTTKNTDKYDHLGKT